MTEADLTVGRDKPSSVGVSAAYRVMALARRLVGRERLLRLSLDAAWLTRRFAFELSGEVFGPSFHSASLGLNADFLVKWIPPGGTVLDVGCGNGRWSRFAAAHAARVVGMDFDLANIALAKAATEREGIGNVEFLVGDVTKDLAGRRFDVALLVHLLEHIEEVDAFLASLAAVTGLLVIEVPDFEGDSLNLARQVLGCRFYSDADHVREYTAPILRTQLERSGWRVLHEERRAGSLLAVASRATS